MALIKKIGILIAFCGLSFTSMAQTEDYENALTGVLKRVKGAIEWNKTADSDIYQATLEMENGKSIAILVDLSISEDLSETKSVIALGKFNDEGILVTSRVITDTSGPADELIFVVVGVILILFAGFFLYMINSGKKLKALERELEDKK